MIVAIELLSGRYAASSYNDRDRVEWPPHPARWFSALVATWAEGEPRSAEGDAELAALQWLEQQPPPEIRASARAHAGIRDAVTVFVPVNDVSLVGIPNRDKLDEAEAALATASDPKARARLERALRKAADKYAADGARAVAVPVKMSDAEAGRADELVNDRRTRQPRTFPSASPACPVFAFVWSIEPPGEIRAALHRLLTRLVRLGHSSSLVAASFASPTLLERLGSELATFTPDEEAGSLSIRWVSSGQSAELIRSYDAHREVEPRVHPARFVRYRQGGRDATATAPCSVFDNEMIVLARAGRGGNPRLPITSTVGVTRQLRRALMACADEPIHEALSGHQPDGTASETPHLAIIPLPSVAGPHPDGSILGFGLVMPRELAPTGRSAIMRALGRLENRSRRDEIDDAPRIVLHLGATGDFELERVVWGTERATLRPSMWSRPSKRWASATPVALDRNPGDLHHADAEKRRAAFAEASAIVIDAVRRIGLPEPSEIDVVRSCVLPGTAKPRMFPRYPVDARRPQRVLVHVRLQFAEPVRGPILIGAGRYHGLGLLAPVDRAAEEMVDVHT